MQTRASVWLLSDYFSIFTFFTFQIKDIILFIYFFPKQIKY